RNLWRTWVHPYRKETMGALDLGGASTQISFITEDSQEDSQENLNRTLQVKLYEDSQEDSQENLNRTLQVKLYGYNYNVYTHSFQCCGRDEAEKRLLALLLQ
ncbi:PREDICTED: ectonucleoside triphosphate diphosphohydrolase 3-like, partial [Nestor notabilis]|uniref:ectonucleoside triphosphate diphosphohydrolase 3-like n=1 Tax=Nestor notabilis TaxID=176057 RepID=UPI0005236F69